MEPTQPLLPEELQQEKAHDNKLRLEVIIGALALIIVILGGVIWYMATHQAPTPSNPFDTTEIPGVTIDGPPQTITENAPYYEIAAQYPSYTTLKATAGASADAKAVEIMKQFAVNTINTFKEEGNYANLSHDDVQMLSLDQRKHALDIKYEGKSGPHTVSYIYLMYMDTGGAHPNTYYRTFTFDKKTGTGLHVEDVFASGVDYLTLLSEKSRAALPAIIAAKGGLSVSEVDTDYIAQGTTPDEDNFTNWYIEGTNLVIVFPPYQVGPYVIGVQEVSIPFASIASSLNATYR